MTDFNALITELRSKLSPADSHTERYWVDALPVSPHKGLWAAIGEGGAATLLVEVPADTPNLSAESQKLKSEIVFTTSPTDESEVTFLRLWIEDERFSEVFDALCNRLAKKVGDIALTKRPDVIRETLSIWRFFWMQPLNSMSRTEEIGLFGELYFLNNWLSVQSESIRCWTGGGFRSTNHDFQFTSFHVEIKTTAAPPPGISHRFHGLKQLELGGDTHPLFLFSCALTEEASGNSILEVTDQILEKIQNDPLAEELFISKLQERGFAPGQSSYKSFVIRSESLYEVKDNFPRIVTDSFRDQLPLGIPSEKINFLLDMQTCEQWAISELPNWAKADSCG